MKKTFALILLWGASHEVWAVDPPAFPPRGAFPSGPEETSSQASGLNASDPDSSSEPSQEGPLERQAADLPPLPGALSQTSEEVSSEASRAETSRAETSSEDDSWGEDSQEGSEAEGSSEVFDEAVNEDHEASSLEKFIAETWAYLRRASPPSPEVTGVEKALEALQKDSIPEEEVTWPAATQPEAFRPSTILRGIRFFPYKSSQAKQIREGKKLYKLSPTNLCREETLEHTPKITAASRNMEIRRDRRHARRYEIDCVEEIDCVKAIRELSMLPRGAKIKNFRVTLGLNPTLQREAEKTFKALSHVSIKNLYIHASTGGENIQSILEQLFQNPYSRMEHLKVFTPTGIDLRPQPKRSKRRFYEIKTLETLSLLGPLSHKTLSFVGKYAKNLKHLVLDDEEMPEEAARALAGGFKHLKSLTLGSEIIPLSKSHFFLSYWLGAPALDGLSQSAEGTNAYDPLPAGSLPSLERLSICSDFFEPQIFEALHRSPLGSQLKSIHLSRRGIEPAPALHSSEIPCDFLSLKEIKMSHMDLGELRGGLREFFSPWAFNAPGLESLSFLYCSGIKDSDIFHLFQRIPNLANLEIRGGLDEISCIHKPVVKLPEGRRVRLSLHQSFFKEGRLAEVLLESDLCNNLESLSLKEQNLGDKEDLEQIFRKKFPFLKKLDLDYRLTNNGLDLLIEYINKGHFPVLEELHIRSTASSGYPDLGKKYRELEKEYDEKLKKVFPKAKITR